MTILHSKKI